MAYMVATETFHTATKKEGMIHIREGQTLPASDRIVAANPSKFVPVEEWVEGQSRVHTYVEAATAAPGETRTVKKPAKKKAVKK